VREYKGTSRRAAETEFLATRGREPGLTANVMAAGATPSPTAILPEAVTAESSGCGAGGLGAARWQVQSNPAQQPGLWVIDLSVQPPKFQPQVAAPMGSPAMSRTANKMVKTLAPACMCAEP